MFQTLSMVIFYHPQQILHVGFFSSVRSSSVNSSPRTQEGKLKKSEHFEVVELQAVDDIAHVETL